MDKINFKDIGNALYKGSLIATMVVGSRYITTKYMGFKDRSTELKPKSVAMLTGDIAVATYTVQKLQDNKNVHIRCYRKII